MSDVADAWVRWKAEGCCGDAAFRGQLCLYHRGMLDGIWEWEERRGEPFPIEVMQRLGQAPEYPDPTVWSKY